MKLGHRVKLDTRASAEMWAAWHGSYSDHEIKTLANFLPEGGVILDVGANIGLYSVPLAELLKPKKAHIVAFEPLEQNIARFRENLEMNGLSSQVRIVQLALSDKNAKTTIELREDFAAGASTGTAVISQVPNPPAHWQKLVVELKRLDDLWPTLGLTRLDVIKCDIDGHEGEFLTGAKEICSRYRPIMMLEYSPPHFTYRGINLGELLERSVPENYQFFYENKGQFDAIDDMRTFDQATDVFAFPRRHTP